MKSVGSILKNFNPVDDKYISREFQSFGIHIAETLDDYKHRALYIKLAKTNHRSILEQALSFVVDSNARNKGALFMWKLKELKSQISNLPTSPTHASSMATARQGLRGASKSTTKISKIIQVRDNDKET